MALVNAVRIAAPARIEGSVRPPGSKSLTNRALIAAALADAPSTLSGASMAEDSRLLVGAIARFGHHVRLDVQARRIEVMPREPRPGPDRASFFLGNAGTAVRFWIAYLCVQRGKFLVDGDPRMRERPVGDLLDALARLGANASSVFGNGALPVAVDADGMAGGRASIQAGVSSQFVSALLLAAPRFRDGLELALEGNPASEPYLRMTEQVMGSFGVAALRRGGEYRVEARQRYRGAAFQVEPDASGGCYFGALAAISRGRIRIEGLGAGSAQGDLRFFDLLESMGCRVARTADHVEVEGLGALRGIDVDMNDIPDTVQTLAAVALFARGETRIRNVSNLRVKETDRIAALAVELSKLGARVEEGRDGLAIHPPAEPRPARISTYGDHRMAMSFAVAASRAPNVVIEDPGCVSKSYPEFFDHLAALGVETRPA
jgi:3-phosphoshikimate 1-carboxyvinyltransferase